MGSKVYSASDGRTDFAVVARSRKAAVAIFCEAGLRMSEHHIATYGYSYGIGEHEKHAPIEARPGVIFEAPLNMRAGEKYEISRYQTPATRAALANGDGG